MNYPSEIPIDRFKYVDSASQEERQTVSTTGTFFFEILPIEIFSRFEDKIETKDYIIHIAKDEYENKMAIVLQVTEQLGTIGRSLTWRKHFASPVKGKLPNALDLIVQELLR